MIVPFAAFLLALAAGDDVLCLKDGRILDGLDLRRTESGVDLLLENGTVSVPEDLILDVIVAGDAHGTSVRRQLLQRREALVEEREHRLWRNRRKETTRHFEFEYTVPQHIFERYRDLMEAYFTAFAKDWGVRQSRKIGRLKVCFYVDRKAFRQIGGAGYGVAGYFRFVPPMELDFFYDRLDPRFTEEVLFHETNHYLTKLLEVDFHYPHFPGESLAEYYGASTYDADTGTIESGLIQEGRLAEIEEDVTAGTMMSLAELVSTERMYEHYNWGWSLVHFLLSEPRHGKKFKKFVTALARDRGVERQRHGSLSAVDGPEVLRQFQRYLGLKNEQDLKDLEARWHDYVRQSLDFVTTRGLERAAHAAETTSPRRVIRARRLYGEAIRAGSTDALSHHRYAALLKDDDQVPEAIAMWRRALELDPLNAQFYASLGRTLIEQDKKSEGQRMLRLALELDPDGEWRIAEQFREALQGLGGEPR